MNVHHYSNQNHKCDGWLEQPFLQKWPQEKEECINMKKEECFLILLENNKNFEHE